MPDIKECDLTEPHRRHNWQESQPYNGFVPQMIPQYHVCPGVEPRPVKVTESMVNYALGALRTSHYDAWKEITPEAMRAALEAVQEPYQAYYDPARQDRISEHDCTFEDGQWWFGHGMPCKHPELHTDKIPSLNQRVVRMVSAQRTWFTEAADKVLERIKADSHDDIRLFHDAVSVLVTAKSVYDLVSRLEESQ